jgi:amphi-Trp domain-containing protein
LLRTGRLTYPSEFGEARYISMPESLYVEVEYKEERDKKKFEIELEW